MSSTEDSGEFTCFRQVDPGEFTIARWAPPEIARCAGAYTLHPL